MFMDDKLPVTIICSVTLQHNCCYSARARFCVYFSWTEPPPVQLRRRGPRDQTGVVMMWFPLLFVRGWSFCRLCLYFLLLLNILLVLLLFFYGSSILKRTLLSYEILRFRLSRIILERKTKLNRKFLKRGHIWIVFHFGVTYYFTTHYLNKNIKKESACVEGVVPAYVCMPQMSNFECTLGQRVAGSLTRQEAPQASRSRQHVVCPQRQVRDGRKFLTTPTASTGLSLLSTDPPWDRGSLCRDTVLSR